MSINPIITWLLLITVFCVIFVFHLIENKKLKSFLRKKHGNDLVKKIARFFTTQMFLLSTVIIASFVTMFLYELQIRNLKIQLQNSQEEIQIILANQEAAEKIPQPTEDPQTSQNQQAAIPTSNKPLEQNTIQDIFETSRNASDSKDTIDSIKSRYEEILVSYFFMQKCEKTKDSDYNLIFLALQKEIAPLQAPERLQYDILTAAKGSYDELYSKNDCLGENLESSSQQYQAYINSLSEKKITP